MEVIGKAVMTLIHRGDVDSYLIRYTFVDSQKVQRVIDALTWCPEITGASFVVTTDVQIVKTLSYDEAKMCSELDALKPGEKIGTITTNPKDPLPVSTKGK